MGLRLYSCLCAIAGLFEAALAMQPITDEMLIGSLLMFIRAVNFATRDRRSSVYNALAPQDLPGRPAEELPLLRP